MTVYKWLCYFVTKSVYLIVSKHFMRNDYQCFGSFFLPYFGSDYKECHTLSVTYSKRSKPIFVYFTVLVQCIHLDSFTSVVFSVFNKLPLDENQ